MIRPISVLVVAVLLIVSGCAGGRSKADLCGNGVCDTGEDSFACPQDCGPDSCGNGEIDEGEECDGTNLGSATCESLGNGSGDLSCLGGCHFDFTGCSSACSDNCSLGESRCNGNIIESCGVGLLECLDWVGGTDCSSTGQSCEDTSGVAVCSEECTNVCDAGSSKCENGVVQSCILGANGCLGWLDGVDCFSTNQQCQFDGTNAICVDNCSDMCPSSGETQCFGTVLQSCMMNVDGCLEWSDSQECSLTGKTCIDSSCQCPDICNPGESSCNGDILRSCSANSFGCFEIQDSQDCSASSLICVESGTTASCTPSCSDQCSAGEELCSGDQLQLCQIGPSGCLEFVDETDCAAMGKVCSNLACECEVICNSGETQCSGDMVQACLLNGFNCYDWQDSEDCSLIGESCSAGSCGFTFHGYNQTSFSSGYSSVSGNAGVIDLGEPYDDAWGDFAIPSFNFYGNDYTTLWISSNGWISLGTSDPGDSFPDNGSLPSTGMPYQAIYAFWDDHIIDAYYWTGAGLYLDVSGSVPSRVITVEWKNTIQYDATFWNDHLANFQIKLYEDTGVIELLYDRSGWAGTIDWSGTVGIEDNSLSQYISVGNNYSTAPSSDVRFTPY